MNHRSLIRVYSRQYRDYLDSPQWEYKRQQRFGIDGYRCVMCGRHEHEVGSLDVHHVTYRNFTHENVLTDLCTLCRPCHDKIHNYWNRRRR